MPDRRICEVLIIGAGAAGLAAAAELARQGRPALVLEGRDRIGGRCWSHQEPQLSVPIELGAEFIHGRAVATFSLLRKAGTAAVDAPRNAWIIERGKLKPRTSFFAEVQSAMKKTGAPRKDMPFEAFLTRMLSRRLTQNAQTFARMLVEGFDAADPARASARAIVAEWTGEGSVGTSQFRPLGGYSALLASLARELDGSPVALRLQTTVHAVRWKRGSVEVEGSSFGQPFRASAARAIITLPLGVLQLPPDAPGAVRFLPALDEKHRALHRLAAGPVVKVALGFRSAFWEEVDRERYRDATFFHSPQAAFPTFWTALPMRAPLIMAWAGGPRAARLAGLAPTDLIREAAACFMSIFDRRARTKAKLEAGHVHDWQQDPFARGAYSYVTVGGGRARAGLAAPLAKTLFFAGEATDTTGEAATVAGALESGRRAAREIVASN